MKIFYLLIFLVVLVLSACVRAPVAPAPAATSQPVQEQPAPTGQTAQPTAASQPAQASPQAPTATTQASPTAGIACSGVLTSPNMEGPYYTAGAPQKDSLIEAGMSGTPVFITGQVFTQDCQPLAGAKVDFWQADADGVYDNAGYRLRGYALTDVNGFYSIETIVPGLYTGRPPHIHVKVFAPDGSELLTTQLYFPGSEGSADVQGSPDLLVTLGSLDAAGRAVVNFNFIMP